MSTLAHLIQRNRDWAARTSEGDPAFFPTLAQQQNPEHLWIGCSDSRVPANQIVGLLPGEMFVHRNVANVVVHTDLNCLSVLQFAVDVLKVKHVIVCGHYGCGGVRAAATGQRLGLIDNWLRHVEDVHAAHKVQLANIVDEDQRLDRLAELNVVEQVLHVCQTTIVQDAWARNQPLTVHAWIYGLADGMIKELGVAPSSPDEVLPAYRAATAPRPR